jgi:four helix bundle protein
MAQSDPGAPSGQSSQPGKRDLAQRLLTYAVAIIQLAEKLPRSFAGRHVGRQLLRSGTSAGANYEEAQAAESRDDFVHKLQIALKELRESLFWLRLVEAAHLLRGDGLDTLIDESTQLRAMLSKGVARAKSRAKPAPDAQAGEES